MVNELPLVSVLIPSYNHDEYVEEAIESIWQQKYPNIEIVVVDDLSKDNSRVILKELQKKSPCPMKLIFNEENIGPNRTLLKAFHSSEGTLILLLASDDLLVPDSLSAQVKLFSQNRNVRILYGNGKVLSCDGKGNKIIGKKLHRKKVKELLDLEPQDIRDYLYKNVSPLFLQCTLITRSLFSEINACDNSSLADDWLINLNIFEVITQKNEYAYVDNQVAYYRVHEGNLYKNYKRQRDLKLEFIENYTPTKFKPEAFSNVHYSIAKTAIKHQDQHEAWLHYKAAQNSQFQFKRIFFYFKLIKLFFLIKKANT